MSSNQLKVSDDVYRRLQQHLDSFPVGFPATKSGVELRILKHFFTPIEAEIAATLNFIPEPIKTVYRRVKKLGITEEETVKHLTTMIAKGTINGGKNYATGESLYSAAFLAIGIFEYQVGRLTKEFVEDFEQYVHEAFIGEIISKTLPQMRPVPVTKSLEVTVNQGVKPDNFIAPYDDIIKIVEGLNGPFSVAECVCRQGKKLLGKPCNHPLETCLQFGGAARSYLEQGLGREITKEEALAIIKKAEEDGLVLQPMNAQKPVALCCCCGDSCETLTNVKKLPHPGEFFNSNYYAVIDQTKCTGCAVCKDRCQMDAITVDDTSSVTLDRCIGCGLCVTTCPENAIQLAKKDKHWVPPPNMQGLYLEIMKHKANLAQRQKQARA